MSGDVPQECYRASGAVSVSRAMENCPLGVTRNCLLLRTGVLSPLPRVTEQTRRQLLKEIDEKGPFEFTRAAVGELGQSNPPLRFGIGQLPAGDATWTFLAELMAVKVPFAQATDISARV